MKIRNSPGVLALLLTGLTWTDGKLLIFEGRSGDRLDSSVFGYSEDHEELDVIWKYDFSITMKIIEFHLNGHAGDFILVSEQPLQSLEDLVYLNNTDDSNDYMDKLAESIITDQGLLLSWKVKKPIEVINPRGTFILFHAEAKQPGSTARFKGFDIQVENNGDTSPSTTSTTSNPYIPPPPGTEIYITKYLDCKEPLKFLRELDDFKEKVASIASEYCTESDNLDCLREGKIRINEINIPGPDERYAGLHKCDPTWTNYETCVEVYFSIQRSDGNGNYVFTASRLEDMWQKKKESLRSNGYCPYEPPKSLVDMNTVVWLAFFLGVILALSAVLGVAWVQNTKRLFDYRRSFGGTSITSDQIKEIPVEDKPHQKHYDRKNPIYNIITKESPREDSSYPTTDYLQVEGDMGRKRSSDNPVFEESTVDLYSYDNNGYDEQENDASPNNRNAEDTLYMRGSLQRPSLLDTDI